MQGAIICQGVKVLSNPSVAMMIGGNAPGIDIKLTNPSHVFKGETPVVTFCVNRDGANVVVGKLWGTGGILSFEGDVQESAQVFFDEVINRSQHLLKG